MGNIALAENAHMLKLKMDSICLEVGLSVFKLNHFFILGKQHVFKSHPFVFETCDLFTLFFLLKMPLPWLE